MRWPILLGSLLFGGTAHAANFEYHNFSGVQTIILSGPIFVGDDSKFTQLANAINGAGLVVLESQGGKILPAMIIGEYIHSHNYATAVKEGAQCASACGMIWVAGTTRMLGDGSQVGFHAAFDDNRTVTSSGNAVVGAYYHELGLSFPAIEYLTTAAPDSMQWLSPEKASELGIAYSVIPSSNDAPAVETPPQQAYAPAPAPIRPASMEEVLSQRLARNFTKQYLLAGMTGLMTSITTCYDTALANQDEQSATYCVALDVLAAIIDKKMSEHNGTAPSPNNTMDRVRNRTANFADAAGYDAAALRNRAALIAVTAKNIIAVSGATGTPIPSPAPVPSSAAESANIEARNDFCAQQANEFNLHGDARYTFRETCKQRYDATH